MTRTSRKLCSAAALAWLLAAGALLAGEARATVTGSYAPVGAQGNGSQTAFTFPWYCTSTGWVRVTVNGQVVTNYSVTLNSTTPSGTTGGTVNFQTPPASGAAVRISRVVPEQQLTHYLPGGPFPSASHEAGLDLGVVLAQQLDASKVSLTAYQGPWSPSVTYQVGQVVTNGGSMWAAVVASTGSAPASGNYNWAPYYLGGNPGPLTGDGSAATVLAPGATTPLTLTDWVGYVVNVKAKGAVGDNLNDDTSAIQDAIDEAGVGGQIFFPAGNYRVTGALIPGDAQTWTGVSSGDYSTQAGSAIMVDSAITAVKLLPGTTRVRFENLAFWGSSTSYHLGSIAVLMEGATGASPINDISFRNVAFWRWDKVITGRDLVTRSGGFQVSNISWENGTAQECHYVMWMDSANDDYWSVKNVTFSVIDSGSFTWIERGGDIGLEAVTGFGNGALASLLVINGGIDGLSLKRCQVESIAYSLRQIQGTQVNDPAVVLQSNILNAPIDVAVTLNMVLIGNTFTSNVTHGSSGSSDSRVVQLGNTWLYGAALVLNSNAKSVLKAAENENGIRVDFWTPPVAVTNANARPMFYALSSAGTTVGASPVTLPFATSQLDTRSNFNGATGVFTAPSAGFYHFDAEVAHEASSIVAGDRYELSLVTTWNTLTTEYSVPGAVVNSIHGSWDVWMLAGHTAQIVMSRASGSSTMTLRNSQTLNWFGGHLVDLTP